MASAPTETFLSRRLGLHRDLLEGVPAIIYVKDPAGRYLYMNRRMREWAGISHGRNIVGLTDFDVLPKDVAEQCAASDRTTLASDDWLIECEETVVDPLTGRSEPYLSRKFRLTDERGLPYGVAGFSSPIGQLRQVESGLAEVEQRCAALFEYGCDAVFFMLPDATIVDCNPSASKFLGVSRTELVGKPLARYAPALQADGTSSEAQLRRHCAQVSDGRHVYFEWMATTSSGVQQIVEVILSAISLDGRSHRMAVFRDITDRSRQVRLLEHMANHDGLTGLSNRASLIRRLELQLGEMPASTGLAVALIDLDRFKEVNDTLGHSWGDHLLKDVAKRLSGTLPDGAYCARLGGDEFGVVLQTSGTTDVMTEVRKLRARIVEPMHLNGLAVEIGASVGLAMFPRDGTTASSLFQAADIAMYSAKQTGRGVREYDRTLSHPTSDRLALVGELSTAIQTNQLVLHYQPLVGLATGKCQGSEALLRWAHPVRGALLPGAFIELAELSDAIHPLARWVLDTALQAMKRLPCPPELSRVSINLSARNLADPQFATDALALIDKHGVDPRRLTFEITESAMLHDVSSVARVLLELRSRGIAIALDDFGRGFTSLSQLTALPIDVLKIDGALVERIVEHLGDRKIVGAIVGLCHSLGYKVVAEGVSNEETIELLRGMRCDVVQGFYCGRPRLLI